MYENKEFCVCVVFYILEIGFGLHRNLIESKTEFETVWDSGNIVDGFDAKIMAALDQACITNTGVCIKNVNKA